MNGYSPRKAKTPCEQCECKEFVSNPWKEDSCINCYHFHSPNATQEQKKKTGSALYGRTSTVAPLKAIQTSPRTARKSPTVSPPNRPQLVSLRTSSYSNPNLPSHQQPHNSPNTSPKVYRPPPRSSTDTDTSPQTSPHLSLKSNNVNRLTATYNNYIAASTNGSATSNGNSSSSAQHHHTTSGNTNIHRSATGRSSPNPPVQHTHTSSNTSVHTSSATAAHPNRPISKPESRGNVAQSQQVASKQPASPRSKKAEEPTDYRGCIANEILETEKIYVKNLTTIIEVFLQPLRKDPKSTKNAEDIFSNIEEILQMNQLLLKHLTERISNWNSQNTKIGDVFLEVGPYLKPYYMKYTENYANAQNALKECEKVAAFEKWLEEVQTEKLGGATIRSYLIMPVQRIPRYNLLLEDLVKHTSSSHPDYTNLVNALEKMKSIANDTNQAIKQGENIQKIINIQNSFPGKIVLLEPHRVFLRDGPLMKVCKKKPKQRWFFLFNDILVYASVLTTQGLISTNRYVFPQIFKVHHCRLQDVADLEHLDFAFQIVTPQKSFIVYATSIEEKFDWMIDITNAIENMKMKKATFEAGGLKGGDSFLGLEAPLWQPDTLAPVCCRCEQQFTLTRRRHHCRACGLCVCGNCSLQKVTLANLGSKRVRVCDQCYYDLTHANPPPQK